MVERVDIVVGGDEWGMGVGGGERCGLVMMYGGVEGVGWGGWGMVKDRVEWGDRLGEVEYEGLIGGVDSVWWFGLFGLRELWGGGGEWWKVGLREEKNCVCMGWG